MLTIRSFLLDSVALLGVGVGLVAGISGYLANVPMPIERTAIAYAWAEPETTGSITPTEDSAARAGGTGFGSTRSSDLDDAEPKRVWTDPPRHRKPR